MMLASCPFCQGGATRHVMSGCVGGPTTDRNGTGVCERSWRCFDWPLLGILRSFCRVINRGCGLRSKVMSGGGAMSGCQAGKKRRLASSTVNRGIQRGWLIRAAWLLRTLFCGPRDGCWVKAQLSSGWVFGVNAQPGSVLLWPAAATRSWRSQKLWGSWITVCGVGRRQRLRRVPMGRMSSSVGDARGMTILAG